MYFNSWDFACFLPAVLLIYWLLPWRIARVVFLLTASYVFYGWVHPWWCILIAASTLLDYLCGLGMGRFPKRKKSFLILSLLGNLGVLAAFKYFDFFVTSTASALASFGWQANLPLLKVMLPAGISFYTLQSLSYTIDIYRGVLKPRRNFFDFALFVSMFPQLVAGPIERAKHLLPQLEEKQHWRTEKFLSALPLLISGLVKKMVVADNIAPIVTDIFRLNHPGAGLLILGAIGFAVQIYADFSGYTDIARAAARMLGFDLMENFKAPYLAISPSDFWRRWHISLSVWIRDYLYIPLGGSRNGGRVRLLLVMLLTLGISGLWHGAAWHFILWGLFHGMLLWIYHLTGRGGAWQPKAGFGRVCAWLVMICLTLFGWLIFRASSMTWLLDALAHANTNTSGEALLGMMLTCGRILLWTIPLWLIVLCDRLQKPAGWLRGLGYGVLLALLVTLGKGGHESFIYFQF